MENKTTMTTELPVNRTYKSTVFTMLYADKSNLLDLYNAMAGTHYADPELLEINTLENAIYMTIKNDVSFLIDGRLSLYEHQSTSNPNLPLRFLLYISHLYSRMTKDENLYGTAKVRIPAPEFVVFYNGREQMPERDILKLSDLFMVNDRPIKLELEAVVLNISGENNRELKAACQTLREFLCYYPKRRLQHCESGRYKLKREHKGTPADISVRTLAAQPPRRYGTRDCNGVRVSADPLGLYPLLCGNGLYSRKDGAAFGRGQIL